MSLFIFSDSCVYLMHKLQIKCIIFSRMQENGIRLIHKKKKRPEKLVNPFMIGSR